MTLWYKLRGLYRFYPVQLPFFQLRRHPFLMGLWGVLTAMAMGLIGRGLGVEVIFYSPGQGMASPFWGTLTWGAAYGFFTMAYHLSTFLLDGHHASFLLLERRPILHYAANNSLIPLLFLFYYLHRYNQMHVASPTLLSELAGALIGVSLVWLGGLLYFSTWRVGLVQKPRALPGIKVPSGLWLSGSSSAVWYYLSLSKGIAPVRLEQTQAVQRLLERVLTKGHAAALVLEVVMILLIFTWGYVQTVKDWYLPASAVVLFIGAVFMMLVGALDFWLKRMGGWGWLLAGLLGTWFLVTPSSRAAAEAYGLSYLRRYRYRPPVWDSVIQRQCTQDSLEMAGILKQRLAAKGTRQPLVWVMVSGGGWRAAYWTYLNLHLLDSLSGGRFYEKLFGLSGASGGLIGAAFWRELKLFQPERTQKPLPADELTQDLLNPIFTQGLLGLFSPQITWEDSATGLRYAKGRAYAFEAQLIRNARAFQDRRLADYREPERKGLTPILIVSPACLTTGQQLLISPLGLSFLCWTRYRPIALELRSLCSSESIRWTSVLRMNAAFPFVLPPTYLPTEPPLEVVDAGAIDNLGEGLVLRFLWEMREAIAQHASEIILIEIRDLPPTEGVLLHGRSRLGDFVQRLGGLYTAFSQSRYQFTTTTLAVLEKVYPIPIRKYTLYYETAGYIPPLGFTLSRLDQRFLQEQARTRLHLSTLQRIISEMGN